MFKVSIIVPNYNHASYLQQRMDSILLQTFKDFEVILMDDNSSDNSRQIIESYRSLPHVKIIFNEFNSGSSFKQWNKGVKESSGEYIWIAESDDVADKDFLSTLVPILDNNPDAALVYSQSYEINPKGYITGTWFDHTKQLDPARWATDFIMPGNEIIRKYMIYHNCVPNASGVLFRKGKMEAIGMADETFQLNGDWLFWIKLMENSSIAFVAKYLNYFRKHDSSVRSTLYKIGTGIYEYSRIIAYVFSRGQFDKKGKRKIVVRFYSILKWSPVFVSMRLELKAFKLLRNSYANLIKYDRLAIWLFAKHLFRRFCLLYLYMIFQSIFH